MEYNDDEGDGDGDEKGAEEVAVVAVTDGVLLSIASEAGTKPSSSIPCFVRRRGCCCRC